MMQIGGGRREGGRGEEEERVGWLDGYLVTKKLAVW